MGTVIINSNSYTVYGTQELAVIYWAGRLGPLATAWGSDSTAQKKAMVMAYDLLERQDWIASVNTFGLREAVQAIKDASYQLAAGVLADSGLYTAETSGKNIKKVEAAIGTSVEFFQPTLGISGRFPTNVMELISDYLKSSTAGSVSGSFSSGTSDDTESTFTSGQFDITRGV